MVLTWPMASSARTAPAQAKASATAEPNTDNLMRMEKAPEPIDLQYAATMAGLFAASQAIEQACKKWKTDAALVPRVLIVVEELFSNTIKHGYGGECPRPVRLRLQPSPRLTIIYEDDAPPFDPTRWKSPNNQAPPLAMRPEGQAGIAMVMGLCASAAYQRQEHGNRLVVTF